jgi:selT/selW/selH-like putative selenoprotein
VAAIRKAFDIEAELIKSGGGAFEVRVNGDLIYSKLSVGEFPSDDEIVKDLKIRGA